MRISQIDLETLMSLSFEKKWEISCSGIEDEGKSADVALLLGGRPVRACERALAAAKLYHEGRVETIIPSGGVLWDYQGEQLSEAEIMARVLREEGIPEDVIVLENEARTTVENMIYGTLQIVRKRRKLVNRVIIVTSISHMKRSLALAKALLPRGTEISPYPSYPEVDTNEWLGMEENQKLLNDGIRLLKNLIDRGDVEDLELDFDGTLFDTCDTEERE